MHAESVYKMTDSEKDLKQFCTEWDQAMIRNNADELSTFVSDDWVLVGTTGGITPGSVFLELVRSGVLVHTRMDSDEMMVKIYSDTGIVTARGTSSGFYKGEAFSFYEWSTSVFIFENGKWVCVHTMLTPALDTHKKSASINEGQS